MLEKIKTSIQCNGEDVLIFYYGNNPQVISTLKALSSCFLLNKGGYGNYVPYSVYLARNANNPYVLSETFEADMKQLGVEVIREA